MADAHDGPLFLRATASRQMLLTPVTLTLLHQTLRQLENEGQGTRLRKVDFLTLVKSSDIDSAQTTKSKVVDNSLEKISEFFHSLKQTSIPLSQVCHREILQYVFT